MNCDVFLSSWCEASCCRGVINHRFSVALLAFHSTGSPGPTWGFQTISQVAEPFGCLGVTLNEKWRSSVLFRSLVAGSVTVSEQRCIFQQRQCQSHYVVGLKVTGVTHEGLPAKAKDRECCFMQQPAWGWQIRKTVWRGAIRGCSKLVFILASNIQ